MHFELADLEDAAALMQSDKAKLEEKIKAAHDEREQDISNLREQFEEDNNKLKEQISQYEKEKELLEEEKERLLKRQLNLSRHNRDKPFDMISNLRKIYSGFVMKVNSRSLYIQIGWIP